jgi:hypothetical protein
VGGGQNLAAPQRDIRPNSPLPAGGERLDWASRQRHIRPNSDGTSALIQPLARRGRAAGLGKPPTSYPPQFQRDIRPNRPLSRRGRAAGLGKSSTSYPPQFRRDIRPNPPLPLWTSGRIGAVINGTSAPIQTVHPPQFRWYIRPNSGRESLYNRIALRLNIR